MPSDANDTTLTTWTIHGERLIDDTRKLNLSLAQVELPDGVQFEQWVLRMPKAAMTVVVDSDAVLMIWRHRFIIDQWVWELPGGYSPCESFLKAVESGSPRAAATRAPTTDIRQS